MKIIVLPAAVRELAGAVRFALLSYMQCAVQGQPAQRQTIQTLQASVPIHASTNAGSSPYEHLRKAAPHLLGAVAPAGVGYLRDAPERDVPSLLPPQPFFQEGVARGPLTTGRTTILLRYRAGTSYTKRSEARFTTFPHRHHHPRAFMYKQ